MSLYHLMNAVAQCAACTMKGEFKARALKYATSFNRPVAAAAREESFSKECRVSAESEREREWRRW